MRPSQNLIWLASFPKSGNTWTRAFLANFFAPKGRKISINELRAITTTDTRQDWYDKAAGKPFVGRTFDDAILLRPKIQRMISAAAAPNNQFVKTHSKLDRIGPVDLILPEVTAAAICIIRNPFDVAQSYARHMGLTLDETIGKMCDAKAVTTSETNIFEVLGRWDHHIDSWLSAPGLTRHVMRYEDMIADPEKAFRGMLGFLKVPMNDGKLRRAIRESSFKALQKQEQELGFRERPNVMERFFASGTSGTWRDALTPAQVARIRSEFLPTLEKHWPEMLEDTAEMAAKA
ncbi:MAG: sulfotransferase domain-containing protein [Pseudomonadota bacterium]